MANIAKIFPELRLLKSEDNRAAFDKLIKKILPEIELYLVRELDRSLKNGSIPSGKYKVADFVNELYIKAYDHFHEVRDDKSLRGWLYKKADELLEDILIEEEFDHTFYEDIDKFSKLEWNEMEENFNYDDDADLVNEEELDDTSLSKSNYILENVFVEDKEKDLIEDLDKKLSKERIHKHIAMVLDNLPLSMRTIFDLTVNQRFKLEDIADIKRMQGQEVRQYLTDARRYIRESFINRYLPIRK